VYACPVGNCGTSTFWGAATLGIARPDVVSYYGNPAGANSGYSLYMSGIAPDTYTVTIYWRQASTGGWYSYAFTLTVTSAPEHYINAPTMNQSVAQPFTISGWALDAAEPTGTGVDLVYALAYHNFGSGEPLYFLGTPTYGLARSDVAATHGARYLNSGYTFTVAGQAPGWYMFLAESHSTTSGTWTLRTVNAYVDIPTASITISPSGTGTGGVSASGLSCPGGPST
jgi:hypothetical protein